MRWRIEPTGSMRVPGVESSVNGTVVPAASGARSIDCNWVVMRRVKNVIRPEVSVAETASGKSRSVKRARSVLRLRSVLLQVWRRMLPQLCSRR